MTTKEALDKIMKLAHKHEVQYWLDEPGTDAEKLGRILKIARDAFHDIAEAEAGPSARLISIR
jgi:hypothetical protein